MRKIFQFQRYFSLFFIGGFFFIAYLYLSFADLKEGINKSIIYVVQKNSEYFTKNLTQNILTSLDDETLYNALKKNSKLQEQLDEKLSLFITETFKYIYVLYRDKEGVYRYLLDGSQNSEEKGYFDEKFDVNKQKWNVAYDTKKSIVFSQNNIDNLAITFLQPIVHNGEVEGILAVDFSTELLVLISKLMNPVMLLVKILLGASALLLILLAVQIYLSRKSEKAATIDALTSLYNRNFLRKFIQKTNLSNYCVVMLDIDHFKKVNDNYGHKSGDIVLQEISCMLNRLFRSEDILVRYGGEEFLLFIDTKKLANKEEALFITERAIQSIRETTIVLDSTKINVTVSMGLVLNPSHYKSASAVIKKADERLYIAKRTGRDKIVYEDETKHQQAQNISINDVQEALEENRVVCHFQPIVNYATKEILKYEALVRIVAKDGKMIYPNQFLDQIQFTNIYNDLTKRVLEIAFSNIKKKKVAISVNLNMSDILDNTIFSMIVKQLQEHEALTNKLTVELLEGESFDNNSIKERLEKIKSYNVLIAVDDFGSGYSNYEMFQYLPIDILKIDGSLIKNIDNCSISYAIAESIVMFAKKLNIKLIAEFVHNEEIAIITQDIGIDCVQGFFISKPLENI